MKKAMMAVVIVVVLAGCVTTTPIIPQEPYTERSSDEFTGLDSYSVFIPMDGGPAYYRREIGFSRVNIDDGDTEYFAQLRLTFDDWKFIERLHFMADGDVTTFTADATSRDVGSTGSVYEFVTFEIDKDVIETAASADVVKLSARGSDGRIEYQLTDADQAKIREYLASL
jgi:hypothetical protein